MIEQAEKVGSSQCRDHSHPVFKLTLKESKSAEGQILSALLAQRVVDPGHRARSASPAGFPNLAAPPPAGYPSVSLRGPRGGITGGVHVGPTSVAYWPVGDGSWRCVGWGDCLNLASQVSGGHWECVSGWGTGDMVCTWTPW
jgi:hypothetical protein